MVEISSKMHVRWVQGVPSQSGFYLMKSTDGVCRGKDGIDYAFNPSLCKVVLTPNAHSLGSYVEFFTGLQLMVDSPGAFEGEAFKSGAAEGHTRAVKAGYEIFRNAYFHRLGSLQGGCDGFVVDENAS